MTPYFYIVKNGYYYRPAWRGYTASAAEAGIYCDGESADHCATTEGVSRVLCVNPSSHDLRNRGSSSVFRGLPVSADYSALEARVMANWARDGVPNEKTTSGAITGRFSRTHPTTHDLSDGKAQRPKDTPTDYKELADRLGGALYALLDGLGAVTKPHEIYGYGIPDAEQEEIHAAYRAWVESKR